MVRHRHNCFQSLQASRLPLLVSLGAAAVFSADAFTTPITVSGGSGGGSSLGIKSTRLVPLVEAPKPHPSSLTQRSAGAKGGIELAGLLYDSTSTAFDAWEWTANLGAPAALVAGAVLVTLSETRESMQPKKSEKRWIRLAKQWFRFLIVSDDDEYMPMILGMRHEEEYLSLIQ